MPPERKTAFSRRLMGDVDVSFAMDYMRRWVPSLHFAFKGGMTFDGRPLWCCEIGHVDLDFRGTTRIQTWCAEASDKASALQAAIDEMMHALRIRNYRIETGWGCG